MKIAAACTLLFLFCAAPFAVADQPAPEFRHVTTAQGGRCFFKMIPEKWHYENNRPVKEKEAWGVAYELDENGEFVELWRTEGWYASEVFLSDDGRYLVRMGVWPTISEKFDDVAVAFYDRGKLLKSYEVRDLVKQPHRIEFSASHYEWRPEQQTVPNGISTELFPGSFLQSDYLQGDYFHLVMIDKTAYRFDLATGNILATETDPGARSRREIWDAERKAEQERGEALYRTWPRRAVYEQHFTASEISADDWYTSGVWFHGTNWDANLTPKKDYGRDSMVEAVFPLSKKGDIEVTITPQEIEEAFSSVLRHPFVAERFKHGATGIRLRITGDRLHWNTPELEKWLKQTRGAAPKEAELRHWAQAIIDEKEQLTHPEVPQDPFSLPPASFRSSFTSFYLNAKTGELLYEDESAPFPYPTVLLDAKGTRIASSADKKHAE
ncbi:hypothetical protein DES53_102504 [Roseimicrobium gellanilyticum]|uniref:WG repeat protein n=1 Tax=Roseimicrobium gellanilyticum TaxID=748857 RepID=A0A366HSN8_9BACT|nr:hypothetical protein [Roseimicrobium gellanilyticum]RBP46118.1 hypothetical protein DES53_102504 [Roseimicrobium gellanilyticum]